MVPDWPEPVVDAPLDGSGVMPVLPDMPPAAEPDGVLPPVMPLDVPDAAPDPEGMVGSIVPAEPEAPEDCVALFGSDMPLPPVAELPAAPEPPADMPPLTSLEGAGMVAAGE